MATASEQVKAMDAFGSPADVTAGCPAQRGAVGGLALAERKIVGMALDHLAGLEAQGLGA